MKQAAADFTDMDEDDAISLQTEPKAPLRPYGKSYHHSK